MQKCTVEVRLGGNPLETVILQNVTPPEVLLLQATHGASSVEFRGERDEAKHSHVEEMDRLRQKYRALDQETDQPVFIKVFPGNNPRIPIRFEEIGFGVGEAEVRVLPDKPGFHGDPKPASPTFEEEEEQEEEEGDDAPPVTEDAAPKKNKGGRPRKTPAAE